MARGWSHPAVFAAAIAIVLPLDSSTASADPWRGLVFFEWTPAAGQACPSEGELTEQVEASLHRRVFAPRANADRVLRASIANGDPHFHVAHFVLTTKDGRSLGDREVVIEERACRETTEALVLAISLMVDLPPMIGEGSPPTRSPSPEMQEPRPSVHLQGGAGPALVIDARPSLYPGAHLSFELVVPKLWPLSIDVTSWIHTARTPNQSRYWLSANMLSTGICLAQYTAHRFTILGCLGPELTVYVGWGTTFAEDHAGVSPTFGGFVQARTSYTVAPRLQAFASVLAVGTPQRVELAFDDPQRGERSAYRTSFFTTVLAFGAAYRFF